MPFLHEYLTLPSDPWRLWMGLPALAMSAVIQFGIAFCFGLLSFWFLEIQSFVILSFAVETVLGKGVASSVVLAEQKARQADLIVMGGFRCTLTRIDLVSAERQRLVDIATCPVLIVK